MTILFLNGPNLNLLGLREPELYGTKTYADLERYIREICDIWGVTCHILQSNHEGVLVEAIQNARRTADAIVLNAAAYTHTSVAILDALKAVALPAVEVHLTDPSRREDFRHISYPAMACEKTFAGFGFQGYRMAVEYLVSTGRR